MKSMMDRDEGNPTIHCIPGAVSCGPNMEPLSEVSSGPTSKVSQATATHSAFGSLLAKSSTKPTKRKLSPLETPETENLTITELQRLVLLEQLYFYREQRKALCMTEPTATTFFVQANGDLTYEPEP